MSALVILPYFDRPVAGLREILRHYTSLHCVTGVQVIACDGGHAVGDVASISDKVRVVLRPNDLRHRFVSEHPCDARFTIICDDDICPHPTLIAAMMQRVGEDDTGLVGVYGRRVCRRTLSYSPRQEDTDADIVLTKLMVGRRDLVDGLGAVVQRHGHLLGALPLNAEDIVFSMLWSYYVGANICLGPAPARLARDDGARHGGLCRRRCHVPQRTVAVRTCLSQCDSEGIRCLMEQSGFALRTDDPFRVRRPPPSASRAAE